MTHFKSKELTNTTITALLIIAVGLGVALYIKNKPSVSLSLAQVSKGQKLTELEEALFNNPGKDGTDEEHRAYSQLIAQNATDGNTIFIKDCTAKPVVLRMSYGGMLSVNNQGTTDIHFGFGDERTLVKAGTSQTIKTDFKNGRGIYGYGCDDKTLSRSIGVLSLTK
jgi:hypothetical protein